MIVVADTTPLNYLALIGQIELLPALYERVLIPTVVYEELQHTGTPPIVRAWATKLPVWCEVYAPTYELDSSLSELDAGERDAIRLALELGIHTLVTDDRDARREAERRNLNVTGTISVLEKAGQRGLIDFRATLQSLEETNFRLSARIRAEFLRRNP